MSIELLREWKDKGWTVPEIARNTGKSDNSIRKQYAYHGVQPNLAVRVSNWDLSKIYNPLDIDGQYCIGFLSADGYLSTGERTVAVYIKETDAEILERIKYVLGYPEYVLTHRVRTTSSDQVGMNIGCKELVEFLVYQYGFSKQKSRTLPFPRHLQNPLPFLRGFMDGDGYIGYGCTFSCGSENFVSGLLDWVKFAYGYEPNVQRIGQNKDCFNVTFRKKHELFIRDLFSYPGLQRKSHAFTLYLPN